MRLPISAPECSSEYHLKPNAIPGDTLVMTTKKPGILVAKIILTGDVTLARAEARGRLSWTVSEARAIGGACREANRRWGCDLSLEQFCSA